MRMIREASSLMEMSGTPGVLHLLTCSVLVCLSSVVSAEMPEWRALTQEDLAMRREPRAPGAPAIILYMQIDRDEVANREERYYQIKILTEEGRDTANVEIRYDRRAEEVRDIEARTIRTDGTIVPYVGEIFEKPLATGSDRKMMAKALALTDAEVGSIVEYRYSRRLMRTYDIRWLLTNALFTREAHYSFKADWPTRYGSPKGLPPGTAPLEFDKKTRRVHLTTSNVPAFVEEEFSPPPAETRYRLDFIHAVDWDRPAANPEAFWKKYADQQRNDTRRFLDGSGSLRQLVLELAPVSDAPEVRLRKLFDACANVRNRSYEPERSEDELARADEPDPRNVRDVWKKGYGWSRQIDLLFMAMAREAGFTVAEVWIASRENTFFDPLQMDPSSLDWLYIGVTVDGKERYFSPGTRFQRYGVVVWGATMVKALRIDQKQHSWIKMPTPTPDEARSRRLARLKLSAAGILTGTVTATYTGREATWRRNREHNEDAAHKRKFLEEDLTGTLSTEATTRVLAEPDWEGSGDFVVEYELTLPDRVLSAGDRRLLPAGWFVANTNGAFRRPERINQIYFWYPWDNEDEVQIELPAGWALDGAPQPRHFDQKVLVYSMDVSAEGGIVRMKRHFRLDLGLVTASSYGAIREFYEEARAGDDQQVVLKTSGH